MRATRTETLVTQQTWRARAATTFECEKRPASGTRGMVLTNHPLASAVGAEMLAAGGNAVDAAIAALFTLTVVEPMMVGILGGGLTHLRLPDGTHRIIGGLPTAPAATRADIFRPVSDTLPTDLDTEGRANAVGPKAVAAPRAPPSWCGTLARFGTMTLADVLEPAIRHAARGFRITPFLHERVADTAADLAKDAEMSRLHLRDGAPLAAGARLVQGDHAEVLRHIVREGPAVLRRHAGRTAARQGLCGGAAAAIDPARAKAWGAAVAMLESANTTHITVADAEGRIVCSTQTINSLFGARVIVPGTGMVANNHIYLFDPHPGHALSIAPGKRATTSMSPMITLAAGRAPRSACRGDCASSARRCRRCST